MTIGTTINTITGQGNGVTTTFTYPFLIPAASDAVIIYTDASGNQTTLSVTQYTIAGIGSSSGGTVTYPLSGSPIATGALLTIQRILPLVQTTSISNQGPTFAATEGELDYQMMVDQQLQFELGTAIKVNPADINPITVLPPAVARENKFLGFDSSGNLAVLSALTGSSTVSAAWAPVIVAATLQYGFGLLNYTSSITNSVIRNVVSKLNDVVSVKDFGAVGDGVTDDTTAVSNALSSAVTTSFALYVPAGRYKLTSPISVSMSGSNRLRLYGAGQALSLLYWPSGNGMVVSCSAIANTIEMKDIAFVTGESDGLNTGLAISQSAILAGPLWNLFDGVGFLGFDGIGGTIGSDYWGTCLSVFNTSYINYRSCMFSSAGNDQGTTPVGTGISLAGTNDVTLSSIVHNISACTFNWFNHAINYGSHVQGVTVEGGCNFNGGSTHILVPGSGNVGQVQLTVIGNQFNTFRNNTNCIFFQSDIVDVQIASNLFFCQQGAAALGIQNGGRITIVGNDFYASSNTSSVAIAVTGNDGFNAATITGNKFQGFNVGVELVTASSGWNVQSNAYLSCTSNTINAGSNTVGGGSA